MTAADGEVVSVVNHSLDLLDTFGQIDHVMLAGKTYTSCIEPFHAYSSNKENFYMPISMMPYYPLTRRLLADSSIHSLK